MTVENRRLKTARVKWRMGQALLPDHFNSQEASLRAESGLRFEQLPGPNWGVAELAWEFNPEGRVRIRRLVLIHRSGEIIDIPGNCDAPDAIDVSSEQQAEVSIYLHFDSGPRFTHESPQGGTDKVERSVLQLKLSLYPDSAPDAEPFKLAQLEKSLEEEWALATAYIPPSTRVAALPFFRPVLSRLQRVVAALHEALVEEVRDAFLSAETVASARQCLRGVFEVQAVLADIKGDLDLHPAQLWRVLTGLYLDVCVHRGVSPSEHTLPYRHRQIGDCFERVLTALEEQVAIRKAETPHATFEQDGTMLVCKLPDEARRAHQVYWLIQKDRIGDSLHLNQVKLASPQRLSTVHQLALRGIPFRPIMNPPFHHSFTSEVEFFSLERGDEWDHALREGKMAYYVRDELKSVRAFIYWRND